MLRLQYAQIREGGEGGGQQCSRIKTPERLYFDDGRVERSLDVALN